MVEISIESDFHLRVTALPTGIYGYIEWVILLFSLLEGSFAIP